jgi:hypothetical protein
MLICTGCAAGEAALSARFSVIIGIGWWSVPSRPDHPVWALGRLLIRDLFQRRVKALLGYVAAKGASGLDKFAPLLIQLCATLGHLGNLTFSMGRRSKDERPLHHPSHINKTIASPLYVKRTNRAAALNEHQTHVLMANPTRPWLRRLSCDQ